MFGVASIAALIVIIASGWILALKGPAWWHYTGVGHFFNSIHLWAVELFFFVMVVHLWGKYWMAAWRGGRTRVWVTGAITFLVAVPTALTGYVSQQNFDAQWISTQAKDGLNSVGVGAFFNVTNFGQMYSYHVLLLPIGGGGAGGRARAARAPPRGRAAVRAATHPRAILGAPDGRSSNRSDDTVPFDPGRGTVVHRWRALAGRGGTLVSLRAKRRHEALDGPLRPV